MALQALLRARVPAATFARQALASSTSTSRQYVYVLFLLVIYNCIYQLTIGYVVVLLAQRLPEKPMPTPRTTRL